MREKYLGDSYDVVKRFWAERLAEIAPLVAHPRFIPSALRSRFVELTTIPILGGDRQPESFGLFLDPDTGIPLPSASSPGASISHAPISFIRDAFEVFAPRYLICFDQSHDRNAGLSKAEQRAQKCAALAGMGIPSFYYVSHAPFLFAAKDGTGLEAVRARLIASGIPASRFQATPVDDDDHE